MEWYLPHTDEEDGFWKVEDRIRYKWRKELKCDHLNTCVWVAVFTVDVVMIYNATAVNQAPNKNGPVR